VVLLEDTVEKLNRGADSAADGSVSDVTGSTGEELGYQAETAPSAAAPAHKAVSKLGTSEVATTTIAPSPSATSAHSEEQAGLAMRYAKAVEALKDAGSEIDALSAAKEKNKTKYSQLLATCEVENARLRVEKETLLIRSRAYEAMVNKINFCINQRVDSQVCYEHLPPTQHLSSTTKQIPSHPNLPAVDISSNTHKITNSTHKTTSSTNKTTCSTHKTQAQTPGCPAPHRQLTSPLARTPSSPIWCARTRSSRSRWARFRFYFFIFLLDFFFCFFFFFPFLFLTTFLSYPTCFFFAKAFSFNMHSADDGFVERVPQDGRV
jgi:hypothetical protein